MEIATIIILPNGTTTTDVKDAIRTREESN